MSELRQLRKSDFKASLIMIVLAVLILIETSSFPMSGSVGGVESTWFVSPALFPLVIVSVLLLCATYLSFVSLRSGGSSGVLSVPSWLGDFQNRVIRDRWIVIGALVAYVYVYIPSMDFYLASFVFLLTLNSRFYINCRAIFRFALGLNLILIIATLIFRAIYFPEFYFISIDPAQDEAVVAWLDGMALVGVGLISILYLVKKEVSFRQSFDAFLCCVLIPFLLIAAFSFLLYVNVPVEVGSVNKMMEWFVYELLGW